MTNFGSHLVDMIVDCVRRDNKVFFIKKLTVNNKKTCNKSNKDDNQDCDDDDDDDDDDGDQSWPYLKE